MKGTWQNGIRPGLAGSDLDEVLLRDRELFRRLNGCRFFITGGTGFWGRWMLESLTFAVERLGLDIKAVVLSRTPARFVSGNPFVSDMPWINFVKGDVRDFSFPEGRFSDVIHLASPTDARMNRAQPNEMLGVIEDGTRRVLECAVAAGALRFFLASSGAVLGRQPPDVSHVAEDSPDASGASQTESAYARGKQAAEALCAKYAALHGFETRIARGFAFVGPYLSLDGHFAIGNFIRDILDGKSILVESDGTPIRSYMYASDMVTWLWKILLDGRSGVAYNVGSEQAISVGALAELVARCNTPPALVEISKTSREGVPPERFVPSTRRARTELGLDLRVPLEEAIRRTVAFHRHARAMSDCTQ